MIAGRAPADARRRRAGKLADEQRLPPLQHPEPEPCADPCRTARIGGVATAAVKLAVPAAASMQRLATPS